MIDLQSLLTIFIPYFICVPIFFGLLCCIFDDKLYIAKIVNIFSSVILAAFSFLAIRYVGKSPQTEILYEVGNFSYTIGIRFKLDSLASFALFFVNCLHLLNSLFQLTIKTYISGIRIGLFLIVIAGLNGLILTNDMFNLYVFLEVASIGSYILCISKWDRQSYVAALEYLLIGTIAGCFVLFGIGFLYASFGTLNMSEVYEAINSSSNFGDLTIYSLIFITLGLLVKTGIYPFNGWYIKVSRTATPSTLGFFSYGMSQVALLIIVKILYLVYGIQFTSSVTRYFFGLINLIAVLSIIIGGIKAIKARNLVDVIAWSSVSQTGYLIIGFLSDNELILTGALMQIFANALSKVIIFYTYQKMLIISESTGFVRVSEIWRFDFSHFRMPLIAIMVNLAGLPMTIGFISKIYMIVGCVAETRIAMFLIMIIGAIFSAVYTFRIIEQIILGNKPVDANPNDVFFKIKTNIWERILYISVAVFIIIIPFWKKFAIYIKSVTDYILQIF